MSFAILNLLNHLISLYIWSFILHGIISWLIVFNVINPYNRAVIVIGDFLNRLTFPLLRLIRRVIPPFGQIDLSPVFAILALMFLRDWLLSWG